MWVAEPDTVAQAVQDQPSNAMSDEAVAAALQESLVGIEPQQDVRSVPQQDDVPECLICKDSMRDS